MSSLHEADRVNEQPTQGKASSQSKTLASTDRSNETPRSNGQGQGSRRNIKEKKAELHEALNQVIERETRQRRIREAKASPEEVAAEALAVEEDGKRIAARLRTENP